MGGLLGGAGRALRGVVAVPGSRAKGEAPARPAQLLVVTEQVLAAELASCGLTLGERLGKGSRATVFASAGTQASDAYRWPEHSSLAVKALLGVVSEDALGELRTEAALQVRVLSL